MCPSTSLEEVGVWEQLDIPKDYYKKQNNFKILDYRSFPQIEPNLENFRLKKGAILTDVLSSYLPAKSLGIFVSKKFKELLGQVNIHGVRFYKTSIELKTGEVSEGYHFMHLIDNCVELIDFDHSVFVDFSEENKQVHLKDKDRVDLPDFVEPKKLVLFKRVDVLRSPYNVEILISEGLKNKMEEYGITGAYFERYMNYVYI